MPEKRFTEEEARRIFARVAERQHLTLEGEPGLTLAEMQEAASASGLDPALVAAVAMESLGADDVTAEAPTFFGTPLVVRQSRVIPVDVEDEGWTRIVAELRRAFGSPGVPTDLGRVREWTSSAAGHGIPVHVTLTPGEGTTTLTIEQTVAKQARGAEWIFPGTVVPMMIIAGIVQATGGSGAEIWWLPALVAVVMALTLGGLWLMWRTWGRKTERQFERALDRVELAAREAAAGLAEPPAAQEPLAQSDRQSAALDLDALPDAEDGEASRTRTRTRS